MLARQRFDTFWTLDTETGCHVWHGSTTWGYGVFWADGSQRRAHRWIVGIEHGPIPADMVVDHLCNNRACVNIDHLEVVTQRVNAERRSRSDVERGCPHGHDISEIMVKYFQGVRTRYCLACARERATAKRRAQGVPTRAQSPRVPPPRQPNLLERGACRNGHVIASEADVYLPTGQRRGMRCRACTLEQNRRAAHS